MSPVPPYWLVRFARELRDKGADFDDVGRLIYRELRRRAAEGDTEALSEMWRPSEDMPAWINHIYDVWRLEGSTMTPGENDAAAS